jgi:hypothetical protein
MKPKEKKKKKTASKGGRPPAVNYEQFVKLWRTANSIGEIAKALNIKHNSVSAIANRLRKKNIKLRHFPRRMPQHIDVQKLNKIANP